MSLVPPNAMIVPIDTRFASKAVILPDVATNPGRYLICKDVYGTANVSSIFFSTLTGNFFEQSWCNTFIGSQAYGAWHLTNDGSSRWFFTNIYTNDIYIYNQTNIVRRGLFFSLEGRSYTANGFWADENNNINFSTGLGNAAPGIAVDAELQNVPSYMRNDFFRTFTPIPSTILNTNFTYSLWFSSVNTGTLLCEASNPSTLVSTLSQSVCQIIRQPPNQCVVVVGYRGPTGAQNRLTPRYDPGWINLAWTMSSTWTRGYINGSTIGIMNSNVRSTFVNSYITVGLGGNPWSLETTGEAFLGQMGSVRLYSTVLTAQEVLQNYNADAFRYGLNQKVFINTL